MSCALVPEVISKKDENAVTSLLNVLKGKWEHILPLPAAFESELFRWSNHWKRQEAMPDESVASIIASHVDSGCLTYWKHRGRKVILLSPQTPHLAQIDNDDGETL